MYFKIGGSNNRAGDFIARDKFSEMITKYTEGVWDKCKPRFALHHADLNFNNIHVDKDLNIICVIDWAFCSAVPLS